MIKNLPEGVKTYKPSQALQDAYKVAHKLGMPLILTGKPGCGKTQFAYWIANNNPELDFYRFNTKSNSTVSDLIYNYDMLSHYTSSHISKENKAVTDFISAQAMGKAIEQANEKSVQSVVLIDEIDKAPRDFPNDLLFEMESFSHDIKELSEDHPGKKRFHLKEGKPKPIVIITSNSEKNLPEAFLRRCIYFYIEQDEKTVRKILIDKGLPADHEIADKALALFNDKDLIKPPGVAEIINALTLVKSDSKISFDMILPVLLKNTDDLKRFQSGQN